MSALLRGLVGLGLALTFPAAQAHSASPAELSFDDLPASTLMYISDYFSFVGQDSQGTVAFALDNNRGRDGEAYQAEHLLVFHDGKEGWVELSGSGRYDYPGKALSAIPDSPFIRF